MVYIPLDYNCKKAQNICENMAFIDKQAIVFNWFLYVCEIYIEKLSVVINWSKVNPTETGA